MSPLAVQHLSKPFISSGADGGSSNDAMLSQPVALPQAHTLLFQMKARAYFEDFEGFRRKNIKGSHVELY